MKKEAEPPKMIETTCHGCGTPMRFENKSSTYVDWDGVPRVYWGKDTAIWICKTCHEDRYKLQAARKATGWLPEKAGVSEYEEED